MNSKYRLQQLKPNKKKVNMMNIQIKKSIRKKKHWLKKIKNKIQTMKMKRNHLVLAAKETPIIAKNQNAKSLECAPLAVLMMIIDQQISFNQTKRSLFIIDFSRIKSLEGA